MGSIGDAYDNSIAEAFFSILRREVLDQHTWTGRDQLAGASFEWIECWHNPSRRHSYNDGLSPPEPTGIGLRHEEHPFQAVKGQWDLPSGGQ